MATIKFTSNLKYNGQQYTAGQTATVEDEKTLNAFLELNVAEVLKDEATAVDQPPQDPTPPADPPQDPPAAPEQPPVDPSVQQPPAAETVTSAPLEGQPGGEQPTSTPESNPNSGNPTPEQIAQSVANI